MKGEEPRPLQRFLKPLVVMLEMQSDAGRFACEMLAAATSAMVTGPLVGRDTDALRAFGPAVVDHVRRTFAAGAFADSVDAVTGAWRHQDRHQRT